MILLGKKLSPKKWLALFGLFVGVALVQLPAGSYFTYVLHTRRVNKVKGTNKRLSYSVLVLEPQP